MDIFVGNLLFEATGADVKKLFEGFGNVASVTIVMRKEKKAPKSRGFGFVQMPDEQQALAAIAALNGKEFMGRVLNVNPARPKGQKAMVWPPIAKAKTEAHRKSELRKKMQPGTYRGGRRTRSYVKRHGLTEMQEEVKPRRRSQDNPMRWRKKKDKPRPWQKSPGEHKPWEKAEGEARPWKKPAGDAKPWSKSSGRPQKSRFKGRKNPGGYKRSL
jgi:RNA recognition motif-containing protein